MVRHAKILVLFVLGFSALAVSGLGGHTAHADPPNSVLDTVKYCKAHTPQKIEDDVCTEKNMNRIRDAVDDGCKGKKNQQDRQDCVENASEKVIKNIADKNPQNKNDFNKVLGEQIQGVDDSCQGPTCPATPTGAGKNCDSNQCNLVNLYVNPAIKLLSIVVLLTVTASLVYAGVQYSASSGDSQKTSAAKTRITNTLLAFLAYAFMLAFLNFLIPGGLFG